MDDPAMHKTADYGLYPELESWKPYVKGKGSDDEDDDAPPPYKPFDVADGEANNTAALYIRALELASRRLRRVRAHDLAHTPRINRSIGVSHALANEGRVSNQYVLAAAVLKDALEEGKVGMNEVLEQFGRETAQLLAETAENEERKRKSSSDRRQHLLQRAAKLSPEAKQLVLADKLYKLRQTLRRPPHGWDSRRVRDYSGYCAQLLIEVRGTSGSDALETALKNVINSGGK